MSSELDQLETLQRTNRQARWIYLFGAGFTVLLAVLFWTPAPLFATAFFLGLVAFNERMIVRCGRELRRWGR